jgi:hypothetical protein
MASTQALSQFSPRKTDINGRITVPMTSLYSSVVKLDRIKTKMFKTFYL